MHSSLATRQSLLLTSVNTISHCRWTRPSDEILTSKYGITQQTNAFIASDELHCSLCYSPPNTVSHCKRTCLSLATKTFCAGDEGASRWRQMRWKHAFELQPNTQTPSFQLAVCLLQWRCRDPKAFCHGDSKEIQKVSMSSIALN